MHDFYSKKNLTPNNVNEIAPKVDYVHEYETTLTKELLEANKNPIFFETGLWKGEAVRLALDTGFEKVFSCDIEDELVDQSLRKFPADRAMILKGDSPIVLQQTLPHVHKPITFWLDAHQQMSHQLSNRLLDELAIIGKHFLVDEHTIMIDDIRLLHAGNWGIDLSDVIYMIQKIKPDSQTEFFDSSTFYKDVLVCRP